MSLDKDARVAVQSTALVSLILFIKFQFTNMSLGGAKVGAGQRAAEDTYQKHPTGAELTAAMEKLDRAKRVVNNDLENIPQGLAVAVIALVCALYLGDSTHLNAHSSLVILFGFFRMLHSIVYVLRMAIPRSLSWFVALLAVFGMAVNGVVAAFKL